MRRLRILTWHVHGNYLYYLSQAEHDFYVPVKEGRPEGYGGRSGTLPWPPNLHEVPIEHVKDIGLDCVLFQSKKNYEVDQYEVLSEAQRRLPRIFLEHNPPREHPVDTRHPVDDRDVLLVHVTYFNDLMWDSGRTPTMVIEHGVTVPGHLEYSGDNERGIAVVNNLPSRGRRLGADIFQRVAAEVSLDLAGMGSETLGGLGELSRHRLLEAEQHYRFFFNPIRYTSLGLSICEAMMVGLPVIGLATTELVRVIENGVSGYVDTSVTALIERMKDLQKHPQEALRLSDGAKRTARERFNIDRFVRDWDDAFSLVTGRPRAASLYPRSGAQDPIRSKHEKTYRIN